MLTRKGSWSPEELNYKKIYPKAVYAPWDDPPIGLRVVRDGSGEIGVIVGRVNLPEFQPCRHCPTCACERPTPCFGWWKVKWEGLVNEKRESLEALEYPPMLIPKPGEMKD